MCVFPKRPCELYIFADPAKGGVIPAADPGSSARWVAAVTDFRSDPKVGLKSARSGICRLESSSTKAAPTTTATPAETAATTPAATATAAAKHNSNNSIIKLNLIQLVEVRFSSAQFSQVIQASEVGGNGGGP